MAADQPQASVCEGATPEVPGFFQRSSDRWVSIGPNGMAYSIAIAFNANGPACGGSSAVIVNRFTDAGMT